MNTHLLKRERTDLEKARRRIEGDKGARFQSKQYTPAPPILSNAVTTITKDNLLINHTMAKRIRIRKLTERECFRLMGVDDADIDKIQKAGISRSQQYKMAGNSIVVDVLYYIFYKAFINTESEDNQLTLF